jgi:hypothetical protein
MRLSEHTKQTAIRKQRLFPGAHGNPGEQEATALKKISLSPSAMEIKTLFCFK